MSVLKTLWFFKLVLICVSLTLISLQTIHILRFPSSELKYRINRLTGRDDESRFKVSLEGTVTHIGNQAQGDYNLTLSLNNPSVCGDFSAERTKLLVVVETHANHSERREVIRETWGQRMLMEAFNFRIIFIIAKTSSVEIEEKVLTENQAKGDLVQATFAESYDNVALKSMLALKWSAEYCNATDLIFKTDDDLYIHPPNLMKSSETLLKMGSDAILCHINKNRQILRKSNLPLKSRGSALFIKLSKYTVQKLPGKYYPRYCAGFGYMLTAGAAKKLYAASLVTPYLFLEDVFVSGFCREKIGLPIVDSDHFSLRPPITPQQGVCPFKEGRINSQEMSIKEIRMLWKFINTSQDFCPKLIRVIRIKASVNHSLGKM